MILLNKKYLILFACFICIQQVLLAQIGNYTKVDKIYRDTYNFIESADADEKQGKDKSLYIVYSDRDENNAYLDELGLKQGEQQQFLTPYFVINESSDFLELVKFDPSIIGKPKGMFSFFYGDKYNFQDSKKVQYVGWIQKDNLLHFSHPKISHVNLKPIVYYLGINDSNTLLNLRNYIKKDSIKAYNDPNLKTETIKSFNTNQFVYLYKYNTSKTAALVSNMDHMYVADSLERIMGWVPALLVKNIGQRKAWKINSNSILLCNQDSIASTIKARDIKESLLFQPEDDGKQKSGSIDSSSVAVHIPLNVWDHYNNKLINVKGGDIHIREIPFIKKENNVFNFHFVFDCSQDLREKLVLQITSLQRIWLLISEDPRYTDKHFTFSASSFGCGNYYTFPKSDSFALWIDYLQKVFLRDPSILTDEINTEGLEKCLVNIIDNLSEDKTFENNIVIVAGEANLSFNMTNNEQLLYDLSKISARLLFFQLENISDDMHQDFILKAKQILDDIGNQYRNYISNYIIDNKQLSQENLFISLKSEGDNIYLHDAPKNSIYTGGIVFPKIKERLNPVSFDVALDSLLNKTIAKNNSLILSLENGSDKLGFLRSKPTERIVYILNSNTLSPSPILIAKGNRNEIFLETANINLRQNKALESGYILSKKELDVIVESYKSIIPLIDKNVKKKQRKQLHRKYKQYYKQLNKLLFYKKLQKKNTIGELIEIKTGITVSDSLLNSIKIKDIHRKSRLSNQHYITIMQSLRGKILTLERVIESPSTTTYIDGSEAIYYYVSKKDLL